MTNEDADTDQSSGFRVFVSHSHKDDAVTARLVGDLHAAGATVWVDIADIRHGDFIERINQGLANADWVVLVLSPHALASVPVRKEVDAALNRNWFGHIKDVIPFLVAPCENKDIPPMWATLHRYDATADYQSALDGLLRAIGLRARESTPPLNQATDSEQVSDSGATRPVLQLAEPPMAVETAVETSTQRSTPPLAANPAVETASPADTERPPRDNNQRDEPHTQARARVLAIVNQDGRVGKTTTAVNLAAYLAERGCSTLIVDTSPNNRATSHLGVDAGKLGLSMYDLLVNDGVATADVLMRDLRPNLSLLPATVDLYAAEMELVYLDHREFRLRRALEPITDQFDYVLIDCPSWLGLLTVNALTATEDLIIPLPCEYFTLESMQQLLNTVRLVRDRLNPRITLFGVVLTLYDPRDRLGSEVAREISEHFPNERFENIIPRNMRLTEAASFGRTILEHDSRSPGALAYKALTEEFIVRAEAKVVAR